MRTNNYDSEFCGNLPIHLTNLIQPYGALLVIESSTWNIIQASENINQVLGLSAPEIIETPLSKFISKENIESLKEKLANDFNNKVPGVWEMNGKQLLVLVHRNPKYLLVEIDIEPLTFEKQDSFVQVYQELKYAMSTIEGARTLEETCTLAANELKRISGFDKVMIYVFDADWNGSVIAEAREKNMESYLGFTFPASDIPKQARELYKKNPYRFIPDREYKPVKLYPVINPVTNSFLDLSDCNIRSVASVHVEYLRNMGVTASMSTRILHDDQLWGLIACHHRTAKYMSYEMCSVFEMMSSIISVKITSLQNVETHGLQFRLTSTYSHLVEHVYKISSLDAPLLSEQGVLKLFNAGGVVISRKGALQEVGSVPSRDQLDELILWLHTRQLKKVFYTDSLSIDYEYAAEYKRIGSGMLVIPINSAKDEYVMVFRPEMEKVIMWGGNPDERIVFEKDEKNYHPRNSFKQWQQKVSGYCLPWRREELEMAETLRSFIFEFETSTVS